MNSNTSILSRFKISSYTDALFAFVLITVVVMFVIPLPTLLIDLLLTVNIAFSLTVLLVSVYILEPLEFSVFPSLLLFATLFRLALNVSTTRLILGLGPAFDGRIIRSFGQFVVGGNYVVGFIIFLILVVIQFLVITKGAERVAEVAARFTLDAMPGKQMSVDADLNAGIINEEEAKMQRAKIRQEADFYGAMDGASKFVKGDAIASIIITLINIIGGLVIGVIQQGLSVGASLQTYTLLTVGDGLVTQIPALLISTATGMVVSRAASDSHLGADLSRQLSSQPRGLLVVAVILFLFGLVKGLPALPFWIIAVIVGLIAFNLQRQINREKEGEIEEEEMPAVPVQTAQDLKELLHVDPLEVEVGYNLFPIVLPEQGGDFLDRVAMIRRQCAMELGLIVPPIRILDNMNLDPDEYRVKLKGIEIASYKIQPNHLLAMDSGLVQEEIEGIPTREPAFNLPALWIPEEIREEAEMRGYTVVDPPSVMATHLTELIRKNAAELLGRQDVKELIENLREDYEAVVEELIPDVMTIGEVQKVLQNLLAEGIPIKDLVTILETLADYAPQTKDPVVLTEYVRQGLSRQISEMVRDEDGVVRVITLQPQLEERLRGAIEQYEGGSYLNIEPEAAQDFLKSLGNVVEQVIERGLEPLLMTGPMLRYHIKQLTRSSFPELKVISFNELDSKLEVEAVGMVK